MEFSDISLTEDSSLLLYGIQSLFYWRISKKTILCSEMEFLDISLTKDSSLLLYAFHSPFCWRILKKTILLSGCKNPYKKYTKQENSSQFMNREETDKNSSLRRLEFMPRNLD
jgi:hypothetical protein